MRLSSKPSDFALVLAGACILCFAPEARTQTGQGVIVGQVTDMTGASIQNVAVRISNIRSGVAHSTSSNVEGLFRVPYLNPGMYQIVFEAGGFKRLVRSNIQVRSSETLRESAKGRRIAESGETEELCAQKTFASLVVPSKTTQTGSLLTRR